MLNSNLFFRFSLAALLLPLALGVKTNMQQTQSNSLPDSSKQPVQIVNGYPQFQLRGQSFFAHSTAFFYNRIPRDQWGASLVKLKSMGINTVDLYLAWNWHEPEEGRLDFNGHTNPRRDVKRLLEMVDQMGFAVIVRPGPVILNEWRNGGYPDWLLAKPEFDLPGFQMSALARLDGHYPPLSGVGANNSEEASKQWLANETHLKYTRRWFADVMRELLLSRQATKGGNLIAIQLDDDQAINRTNYNGPLFWKYMNTLAAYLREAGATVPVYINPTDMRVSAAGAPHNIGAMGQWYFNFGSDPTLRWEDTATLQFYTETLKTQPRFPPMLIEYQAGWYGTGDDTYAKTADPTNTLLSSRLMLGHGLRGLNYFPVQDTLYPAGYEVPWTNHYYTWESALNLAGNERPRAAAVQRNGRLIAGLGRELAATHKAADVGLIYPISSFDQATLKRAQVMLISQAQLQIQQFCQLNQIAVEYIDLEFQKLEHLQRHKVLILPVFDGDAAGQAVTEGREEITAANEQGTAQTDGATGRRADRESARAKLTLSSGAQQLLAAYVRAGGTLICTPITPQIEALKGHPRVIVTPDLWREIPIEPGKVSREALIASVQNSSVEFVSKLARLGVNRRVKARVTMEGAKPSRPAGQGRAVGLAGVSASSSVGATIEPDFIATILAPDEGSQCCGFVSAANFDDRRAMRVSLNVDNLAGGRLNLPEFSLRPRDAMMLPLNLPLSQNSSERIIYATAELLNREMVNGRIKMRFYAPDAADVALHLPHAPQGVITIDDRVISASYGGQTLAFKLAAPARGVSAKKKEEFTDRREHEHDVEIVYEKGAPELNIKTTRLIIGQDNQIAVDVANGAAQLLKGKLTLEATQLFNARQMVLDVDLKAQELRQFKFTVPVSPSAVANDLVTLRAALVAQPENRTIFSPSIKAEILPRFGWRIYPRVTWPLRADSAQTINPPLIYPSDDKATEAKFNLRLINNSYEPITITRKSVLSESLPAPLKPEEEYQSTYTYNFASGTKSALNPFAVSISYGKTTEIAMVNFVALRKGEAVAFACDIDGDGFDDYVMENEFLRLIISPRAGARAFALINKQTGVNVFTSVGGLRDKFTELDPQDTTRNPRRKPGMYGTFNRPYSAEIVEGMGQRATLKLGYDGPEIYLGGARIERLVSLKADDQFFIVDYRITPGAKTADGKQNFRQSFWSSNSIIVGDPLSKARQFVAADGAFDFAPAKSRVLNVQPGWVAAQIADRSAFALLWRPDEINEAEVEMKDFSSFVNLKFKPLASSEPEAYRLAFYFGSMTPQQLAKARLRMLGE